MKIEQNEEMRYDHRQSVGVRGSGWSGVWMTELGSIARYRSRRRAETRRGSREKVIGRCACAEVYASSSRRDEDGAGGWTTGSRARHGSDSSWKGNRDHARAPETHAPAHASIRTFTLAWCLNLQRKENSTSWSRNRSNGRTTPRLEGHADGRSCGCTDECDAAASGGFRCVAQYR